MTIIATDMCTILLIFTLCKISQLQICIILNKCHYIKPQDYGLLLPMASVPICIVPGLISSCLNICGCLSHRNQSFFGNFIFSDKSAILLLSSSSSEEKPKVPTTSYKMFQGTYSLLTSALSSPSHLPNRAVSWPFPVC